MNILFTCGGTAGHIYPALAIARLFQERKPQAKILFVGAKGAIEEQLIPKEGFPLETVVISPFHRSLRPQEIRYNMRSVKRLIESRRRAEEILKSFQPHLVVGTGGFASYPVMRAAARAGIPTAIHESNAIPGATTRRLSRFVDLVMVGLPDTQGGYLHPQRVVLTGTPVRSEFFSKSRKEAREKLGIPPDAPLAVSYWGSLGAREMNRHMVDYLEILAKGDEAVFHIHGAGRSYETMRQALRERQVTLPPRIRLLEYIYDMPDVMAAADLVLCRAGASTISELTALGRAAIIVPSPFVTGNHQEKNARVLEEAGGAVLLQESLCSGEILHSEVNRLLREKAQRVEMEQAMAAAGIPDAAQQIYQTLMKLLQKPS